MPAAFERVSEGDVPATFEPVHAVYPPYRIDNMMSTISIMGSEDLTASLTRLFRDKTDIKVIDPASLQASTKKRRRYSRRGFRSTMFSLLRQTRPLTRIIGPGDEPIVP
jgi:hypothetical protein